MGRGTAAFLAAALVAAPGAAAQDGEGAPAPAAPPEPAALRSLFGPEYDRALAAVGLDRSTARITAPDFSIVAHGRFRTPLFEALIADPTLSDRYARTIRGGAFAAAATAEGASSFAAARIGVTVRLGLVGDPLTGEEEAAAKPGALEEALRALGVREPPPADGVPPRVRAAAALVLRAAARSIPWRDRALGPARPFERGAIRNGPAADATVVLAETEDDDRLRALFEREAGAADLRALARAAAEVLLAADRAAALLGETAGQGPFAYRAGTAAWTVLLRGGGDDADGPADRGPFLLRIDTGGNDRYGAGAAASPLCPVSVLLDAAGDDVYEGAPGEPAFGAGFFGTGVLVDLAGDDRYALRGRRSLGLGAGVFGVGVLSDRGGDDVYEGDGFCQGAGAAGWGALADLGGKDRYRAYTCSQGFGFTLGAGLLADFAGDDRYELDDADLRFPSAQSKEHNSSLGQGFGFGQRADYLDGHSLAGGVGILADREGDDAYSCGVFGQGGGYWMGVGMLLDGAGRDAYRGAWYVQGACAHFAVGVLEDGAGDDAYEATLNMAQGAGHDYSVGVLLERGGNDRYAAPNLSLGGGNADGIGILVDAGGDDAYRSRGVTLGCASVATPAEAPTVRHASLTLGVFLDLGGRDAYLDPEGKPWPFAGDGRTWRQFERAGKPPESNERGVGYDRGNGGDVPK